MVGLWRSDCAFTLLCVSTLVSISCIDINKKKTANLHLWIDPVLLSQSVNLRVEHLDMLMSRHWFHSACCLFFMMKIINVQIILYFNLFIPWRLYLPHVRSLSSEALPLDSSRTSAVPYILFHFLCLLSFVLTSVFVLLISYSVVQWTHQPNLVCSFRKGLVTFFVINPHSYFAL